MRLRLSHLVSLVLTVGVCPSAMAQASAMNASAPSTQASTATTPSARTLKTVADSFFAAYVRREPVVATRLGMPGASDDRLADNSLAARRQWEALEDGWLASVRRLDPSTLAGSADRALYAILREFLEAEQRARVCHRELWNVRQLFGWHADFALLGKLQPVGTPARRALALSRWRAMPRFIRGELANARQGVREGYTVPRGNVEAVVRQLDGLLAPPPDESPFAAMVQRDSNPAFRAELVQLIATEINPALREYRSYLADEYLPAARTTVGLDALPHGSECYRAQLRESMTLDLEPRAIHELGLAQMQRIEAEMRTVGERSFGTTDVSALLQRLRTDSEYTFRTKGEMVGVASDAIGRARVAIPRWFRRLPKADMIVDPCLPFEEASGCPASYSPAAPDGSRPGRYRINTGTPTKESRATAQATAFHEGIPGHHLQVALAAEMPDAHPVSRFFYNSAFSEGWGLYAERLADEMGLYSSDLDRMGMLSNDALRAARLVVDPGLHAMGWSRQQAIDYMLAHTSRSRAWVESEVDRYIIMGGQATAYMIGRLEIDRLRHEAERKLGARFDIQQFHEKVLENGSVPLPFLAQEVERWLGEAAVGR